MRIPTRRSEILNAAKRQDDHYLTKEAVQRMKKELDRLIKVERGPAAEEVARTAQMGDLSENAAYQFAKQHLRRINDRILSLENKIKHAIVIDDAPNPTGVIRIGSTVAIKLDGKDLEFQILGAQETSPGKGRISYLSPLGSALMGHKAGDSFSVTVNGVKKPIAILDVK